MGFIQNDVMQQFDSELKKGLSTTGKSLPRILRDKAALAIMMASLSVPSTASLVRGAIGPVLNSDRWKDRVSTAPMSAFVQPPVMGAFAAPVAHWVTSVVVVDWTVSDYQTLIAGMDPTIPVIVLQPGQSGLRGLAQALASYHDLETIHLVTEGHGGAIQLGRQWVDDATIKTDSVDVKAIGNALKVGGGLKLYGCSVAEGASGKKFVNNLSHLLGDVDVAASTNATGPTRLGGDWDLEYSTGGRTTILPFALAGMQNINHNLACTMGTGTINITYQGVTYSGTPIKGNDGVTNAGIQITRGGLLFYSPLSFDMTFSTLAAFNAINPNHLCSPAVTAPTVTTNAANAITTTGATLNGTESSNNAATTATFDYGLTNAYGSSATATQSPLATSASGSAVSKAITGLTCNTTYHFRAKGVNSAGTTNGSDTTFTTSACANQTITFANPGAQATGTTPTLTATATSGLSPTFTSATTGVCTITSGGALTLLTPGTCTINADQAGNASYNAAAQVARTFTVYASATTVFQDDFTAANGTALSGRTPTVGSGTWSVTSGGPTIQNGSLNTYSSGSATMTTALGTYSTTLAAGKILDVTFATLDPSPGVFFNAGWTGISVYAGATEQIYLGNSSSKWGITGAALSNIAQTVTPSQTVDQTVHFTYAYDTGAWTYQVGAANVLSGTATNHLALSAVRIGAGNSGSTYANINVDSIKIAVGVAGTSQTVTFGTAPSVNVGATGTVSATATSGLTPTFTSTTPAVCTVSGSAVTGVTTGTCTVAANQAGNATYNVAPQVTQNIIIGMGSQTIAFGTAPTIVVGGTGTVTATGGASGNAVTFTSTTTGVCTVSGSTVTGVTTGTCTVAANQAGNATYNAAPQVTQNITIGLGSQTIAFGNPGAQATGTTPTLTATATSSLAPTFTSATAGVCTITSSGLLTLLTPGTCTINADQAGNANYNSAAQIARSFTVYASAATVFQDDFAAANGTALSGRTPTVGSGTWSVTSGGPTIQNGSLNTYSSGSATMTTALGTYSTTLGAGKILDVTFATLDPSPGVFFNAGWTGISLFSGATEQLYLGNSSSQWGITGAALSNIAQTVTPSQTVAQTVHFTYVYDTGAWTYQVGAANVLSGTATNNLALSAVRIGAGNSGSTYANINVDSIKIAVGVAGTSQTVTFGTAPSVNVGATGTISATATSGLTPTFTSTTPAVCTVSGSTVTGVTAGTCTVAANQAGNATYNAATQVTQNITVAAGKSNQTITFGTAPTVNVGSTGTVTATATSGLASTFTSTTPTYCTVSGSTVTGVAAGLCTIAADQAGNASYNAATQVTQSFTIMPPTIFDTLGSGSTTGAAIIGGANGPVFGSSFDLTGATASISSVTTLLGGNIMTGTAITWRAGIFSSATDVSYPQTWVADLGTVNVTGVSVKNTTFTPGSAIPLVANTRYWVVFTGQNASGANTRRSTAPTNSVTNTNITMGTGNWSTNQTNTTNLTTLNGITISNTGYSAANTVIFSFTGTVTPLITQAITFGTAPTVNVGGTGAVSATGGGSNNAVTFTSTTTGVCTVSGSTVTGVTAGTCTIAADQAGNASYNAATQVTQDITIGMGNQTITFGSAPSVVVGATGTVTATATSGLAPTFTSSTTGVCTVSGSTVTGVSAGTCTIAANQTGNTNYNAATQVTQNIIVGKGSQTITFGTAPTVNVGGTGTVTATATSGLAPVFTSTTTGVCTVSGSTVTGVTAGTCTIAANQAGNATYNAATQVTQNITIGMGNQTITFSNPGTKANGATPTLTATATSGLAPTFTSATTGVCTITSAGALTTVSAGSCTIAADQAGNANYNAAPQVTQTFTILPPNVFNTLGSAPQPASNSTGGANKGVFGSYFELAGATASVSAVTMSLRGTSGGGAITWRAGIFSSATGGTTPQTWVADLGTASATTNAVANVTFIPGSPIALDANKRYWVIVTNQTTLQGAYSTTTTPTDSVGNAKIAKGTGYYNTNATNTTTLTTFNGFTITGGSFAPSPTVLFSVAGTVTPIQTITFGTVPTVNVGGTGTVSATGGGSGNAVTFTSTTPTVCTVSGSTVTGVTAGTCTIVADQAGNANYNAAAQVTQDIAVSKAGQTITFGSAPSVVVGGADTASATATSGLTLIFTSTTTDVCTVSGSTVTGVTAGTCTVAANQAGNATYNAAPQVTQSFSVGKGAPHITNWPTATAITLGQTLASATLSGGSYTPAGSFAFTAPGTAPGVGAAGQAVTFTPTDTTNYTTASGTVNVTVNYSAVKPTLTVSTLADTSVTKVIILNISGSADGINGITSVTINGVSQTLGSGNSFSYAYTLVPGANLITTVVTDNGNQTTTDIRTITLDQTAPTLTLTVPTDNSAVNSALLTVTGSVNDATAQVDVTLNGGSPLAATFNGLNFSRDLTLSAGANTIQVTATDLAQNSSSVSRTVTYDNQAPSVAVTSPATDITTDQASMTITGTVSDALTTASVTITCDSQSYTPAITDGAFSQALTFATAKSYAIVVTATDAAGNQATAQRNVIYQPAKAITIATAPAGLTFTVAGDATVYTAPHDFSWLQGDKHIISVASPQNVSSGSRSIFRNWSDTGAASHEITVGATSATYTAQFDSQYQITTAVTPAANGYVLPVSGTWYAAGSSVNVSVVPNTGNRLASWSGSVANAANAATTVTMSGPVSVTANLVGIPSLKARVTGMSGAINSRVWGVEMANSGTGTGTNVKITGVTVTKTSGAVCTPVVTSALPLTMTDVAQGGTQNSGISIDFTGCAATNKFSVLINYSYGDGGSGVFTGTNSSYNLFR